MGALPSHLSAKEQRLIELPQSLEAWKPGIRKYLRYHESTENQLNSMLL